MNFANRKFLYALTDRRISGLSHAAQTAAFVAGGADLVQLREKSAPAREFFDDAREALAIARAGGAKLIVNDRVDIALALGADGVHLGQDDLPPAAARRVLGADAIIGFSTHGVAQALEALAMPLDYIAVGPAFPTGTKENPDAVVGVEGVAAVRSAVGDFPLVAIGGIDHSNFLAVLDAGADHVAVVSALLRPADDVAANVRRFFDLAADR